MGPTNVHGNASGCSCRHFSSPAAARLTVRCSLPAGFWAAATAAFNRGYQMTTFKEDSRWRLLLLWPLLLLTNRDFRVQFWAAVRGRAGARRPASGAPPSAQF